MKLPSTSSFRSSMRRVLLDLNSGSPNAVYALIGVNIFVYGAWYRSESDRRLARWMHRNFTISYNNVVTNLQLHTILTSTFSHASLMHLGSNLLGLYFFGTQTIAVLGMKRFLALYLTGGVVGNGLFLFWPFIQPDSWKTAMDRVRDRTGANQYKSALGASGSVSCIAIYNILTFPTQTVLLYGIIPMPAFLLGLGILALDFHGLSEGTSSIGHEAHIGGAIVGAAYFAMKRFRFRR